MILAAAATLTPLDYRPPWPGAQQEPVYGQASAPVVDQVSGGPWTLSEGSVNSLYPAAQPVGLHHAAVLPLRQRRRRDTGSTAQLLQLGRPGRRDGGPSTGNPPGTRQWPRTISPS